MDTPKDATVAQLDQFDEVVDVRSPGEFALDHIQGAINCPVLADEEREVADVKHVPPIAKVVDAELPQLVQLLHRATREKGGGERGVNTTIGPRTHTHV